MPSQQEETKTHLVPSGSLNARFMSAKLRLSGKYARSGTPRRSPTYGRNGMYGSTSARAVECAIVYETRVEDQDNFRRNVLSRGTHNHEAAKNVSKVRVAQNGRSRGRTRRCTGRCSPQASPPAPPTSYIQVSHISPQAPKTQTEKGTHLYGLRLTIVHPTPGEIVCGAFAMSWRAVEFGSPFELICAK